MIAIKAIDVFTFSVPLRLEVRHAAAIHTEALNFIVRITTTNGIVGIGEGCPRAYVTQENLATSQQFINKIGVSFQAEVDDVKSLQDWSIENEQLIDQHPSAFCALEMAFLSALGQHHSTPIEPLLKVANHPCTIQYTGVLGDLPYPVYSHVAHRYVQLGFKEFKIKLSGDLEQDQAKLQFWQQIPKIDQRNIRVDANNLWATADQCINYLHKLPSMFWAIEEPIEVCDYRGMQAVADELMVRIILDESVTTVSQVTTLDHPTWIANLRISKLGGILRTLRVARSAINNNLSVILGAHVGETSLLTRAALVVAQFLRNQQLGTEGAFGTHLLKHDLTTPSIQFEERGQLDVGSLLLLKKPGVGLEVDVEKLSALS